MSTDFQRGSEWRRWDLHIHSPLSFLNNQFPQQSDGQPDWETYLSRLEELELAVVGVTDYFTIEGYKKLHEFKAAGRLTNVRTILPNIEFRLDNVLSSKKDSRPRRLNFHVLLSDELKPEEIEEHFLHDLEFCYEGNPQDPDESRKLKISNIRALGERLKNEHPGFKDRDPLELGASNTVVRHADITKILTNGKRFAGKYLLVFPDELYSLIDWDGQDHLLRKAILQKSDMVFSANANISEWCLGRTPYEGGPEAFREEFKTLKPTLHGSDAHYLDEVDVPCAKRGLSRHSCSDDDAECDLRYTWIKSDPTFEGLKQLLYEPVDRVRIQASNPRPVKSQYCLTRIEVTGSRINDELAIGATTLDTSSDLVAVAGGKGSGKTALVDLIAHCYVDRRYVEDRNSFVRRIIDDDPQLTVTLKYADGTTFNKSLNDADVFEDSRIVYIAQGELEEHIGDGSDLEKHIRSLIFESPEVKGTVKAFEFEHADVEMEETQERLSRTLAAIDELEQDTADEPFEALRLARTQAEAELKDLSAKIKALEEGLTDENREASREAQSAIGELEQRREQLLEVRDLLREVTRFVEEDLPSIVKTVASVNSHLDALGIDERLRKPDYDDQSTVSAVSKTVDARLRATLSRIEQREKEVQRLEQSMQGHGRALSKKRESEAKMSKAKVALGRLREKGRELASRREEGAALFSATVSKVLEQRRLYDDIIAAFSAQKDDVLAGLEFSADLVFDNGALFDRVESIVDNREVDVRGRLGEPALGRLVELYEGLDSADKVGPLVSEIERLSVTLKDKLKSTYGINQRSLYGALYGHYLKVVPVVTYKRTPLRGLSLGQKATVLLKIYLAQGEAPIVIDSHDDYLDNEFIMTELVDAIRQARQYRQVILVSNNGNVVINSDAEQVIIASRDDEISYRAGSLENPMIRNLALRVLEGGEEAFRRRQQKYRLGV